jgi:hypothetical protein
MNLFLVQIVCLLCATGLSHDLRWHIEIHPSYYTSFWCYNSWHCICQNRHTIDCCQMFLSKLESFCDNHLRSSYFFFQGIATSGFYPGMVYYLSSFYCRKRQPFRVAIFFGAATLSGAFGSLLVSICESETQD